MLDIGKTADIVTLVGFPIGLFGIGVAIYQIIQARSVSEAAKQAVLDFKQQLVVFNVVEDFAKTLSSIEDLKRFIRHKSYIVVPDKLSEIRKSMVAIRDSESFELTQDQKVFQSTISTFKKLEENFEAFLHDGSEPVDTPRIIRKISEHSDDLQSLLIKIRNTI